MENEKKKLEVKSYAIVKIPAKVVNLQKASDMLGTKKEIYSKIKNGQDLEFDFFYNKLPLENCFSNDILIKRKVYRNKKNKTKKYKYQILGKITNNMQAFSLENFIYINEKKTNLDDLQKYIISKEEYEEEIKDKNKEMGLNEESQIISNLIRKKNEEINKNNGGDGKEEKLEDYFSFFQPLSFANFKNSSQNVPKLIKEKIEIDKLNEFNFE